MNYSHIFKFFIAIVILFSIGAGCEFSRKQPESQHNTQETIVTEELCLSEGKTGDIPCCEGLELVAVDHAFASCEKIRTKSWEAGQCSDVGEIPYIDKPCCDGLTAVEHDTVFLCE